MTYTIIRDDDKKTYSDKTEFSNVCDLLDERGVEYTTETPEGQ